MFREIGRFPARAIAQTHVLIHKCLTLPEVSTTQFLPSAVPEGPYWAKYEVPDGTSSNIAFTQNLHTDPILFGLQIEIAQGFSELTEGRMSINPKRVNLIRTVGGIPPHIDEKGRKLAINVGIFNADRASTIMYSDGSEEPNFMENGKAYWINTNVKHGVVSDFMEPRWLLTYAVDIEQLDRVKEEFHL